MISHFLLTLLAAPALCLAGMPHDLRSWRKNIESDTTRSTGPARRYYNEFNTDFNTLDTNPNGSTFLWLIDDDYSGDSFFDGFGFYADKDPTNGSVDYVDAKTAFAKGLAYVDGNGKVIMKADNTSWLGDGVYRESVRISSFKQYNTGLFILDLNKAPWGCAIWPAFWTLGSGTWPTTGEIDIIEGVHDNEHNQVAWHTTQGCYLNPNGTFTGKVVGGNTDCDGNANSNSGCGITEWSRASYGPYFDAQGGGVFAMKWDENGISTWSFYRAAIPQDIIDGSPNPSTWGTPTAWLDPSWCDPLKFFVNHSIIFDITICGDWAGNSYATSGCPGSCADRLKDPGSFVNASWSINSLKVYRKQALNGALDGGDAAESLTASYLTTGLATLSAVASIVLLALV